MKGVAKILHRNGYKYTKLYKGKRSYVYEQTLSEKRSNYEVFLIKTYPEWEFNGVKHEATERFPTNEAFGYWAWTYPTLEKAMKKFNELEN